MTNDTAVMITETKLTNFALHVQATCGKVSALVCIGEFTVGVIVQNASNKALRRMGKWFPNVAEAVAAYKSEEVKAIILAADGLNH
jgi:hypothetical protein